jgi:protein-tyrosine-phosphatase
VIIHTPDLVLQNVRFQSPAGAVYSKVKDERINVLFVCLGNASRSQMAEAFAKAYGPDVMRASSAGLLPARHVLSTTRMVMEEKSISLRGAVTKGLSQFVLDDFDLIVNMSGHALPKTKAPVVKVLVRDPNGKDETVHRHVRDRVEAVVEDLIHMLRLARLEQYGMAKETSRPKTMAAKAS